MNIDVFEIIEGSLLGDGSINIDNYKYGRYFCYKLTAKDRKFVEWVKLIFQKFGITNCWITCDNKILNTSSLYFYINNSPYSEKLISFREKWYKKINDKTIKIIPRDLKLTPTTLLFWYLGDGSLIRRKSDKNRVPFIVLATNSFSKEDVELLIKKLKQLNLNFYPVRCKSGFTGKECGYCLYPNTQDGTPFRFFKLIGFECPKEIANCSTGRKRRYGKEKFFKDKWPAEEDWIKILSNVKEIGPILRRRRLKLGLSQNQLAKKIGIRRENIRDVELSKRCFSVKNFIKVLKSLNLSV
ncbi:MAG: helix-turn-helix domain-containing protein, partial [Candidatus Aenigmatarchaeota archaeon]